ncbi:MAG: porin [Verrucomicrobiota bacterium]
MKPIHSTPHLLIATLAVLIGITAPSALAGTAIPHEATITTGSESEEASVLDKIWALPVLYEGDDPYIQKIAIIGRYQGQYAWADSNRGEYNDWINRRFRLGTKINFLQNFEFETQLNLKRVYSRPGRFFRNFDTLFITWEPSDDFYLQVGQHKPKVTQEYATSSKYILTFERSLLVAQTIPAKIGGVTVGGNYKGYDYSLGIFSGALSRDWLLPEFTGGIATLASLGRDVSDATKIRGDWFFTDGSSGNNAVRNTKHLISLNSTNDWGDWGLNTDFLYSRTLDSENLYGIVLMPWVNLTDKIQAVFRYQFAASGNDTGIRSRALYERLTIDDGGSDRGDRYNAFYAGLTYYVGGGIWEGKNKHRLKIMNGIEYADLNGPGSQSTWTYIAGIRTFW